MKKDTSDQKNLVKKGLESPKIVELDKHSRVYKEVREKFLDEEGKLDKADISRKADLFWALTDIYNIEKHLYYTIFVTKGEVREKLARLLREVRLVRADLLHDLTPPERAGAIWCIQKHLLGAASQLCEVATKDFQKGDFEKGLKIMEYAKFFHDTFFLISEGAFSEKPKQLEKGQSEK